MLPNKLFQLIKDNAKAPAKAPFHAEISGSDATLYVYDVIVSDDFYGGVGAENFVKEVVALSVQDDIDTVKIRFNTPGGDVFAARAMEAAVRACPKKTVAYIDGYAASAGSYLALACDEVEIAQGGFFMIHKAWTISWGNADDLLAQAAILEKIDASLVDTYAAETGQDKAKIADMMAAETWLSSQEAIDLGFADRLETAAPKGLTGGWNLAAYSHAPVASQDGEVTPGPKDSVSDGSIPVEAALPAEASGAEAAQEPSENVAEDAPSDQDTKPVYGPEYRETIKAKAKEFWPGARGLSHA